MYSTQVGLRGFIILWQSLRTARMPDQCDFEHNVIAGIIRIDSSISETATLL